MTKPNECIKSVLSGTTEACSDGGNATYRVEKYFLGEARKKHGSAMKLCSGHAREWNVLHPLGAAIKYGTAAPEDARRKA